MRLVSVIIPAYNATGWLAECLTSVQQQTYASLEILIVDDGSTDQTRALALSLADARTRVLHQANAGAGAARNHGLRDAQGEYIQFLDADDLLSPDKIASQVAMLEASDADTLAVSRFTRFHQRPGDMGFIDEPSFRDWNGVALMHYMMTRTPGGTQPTGSWLIPRALVDRVGPWSEQFRISPIDDGAYLYRLLAACSVMRYAERGMLYYRTGIGGMSTLRTEEAVRAIHASLSSMVASLLACDNSSGTRYAAARTFQRFIYDYYPFAPHDLIAEASQRCAEFGGATDVEPEGSPKFHAMRRVVGWKVARRAERWYQHRHH